MSVSSWGVVFYYVLQIYIYVINGDLLRSTLIPRQTHLSQSCWWYSGQICFFFHPQTFDKILIANRGEIACRVSLAYAHIVKWLHQNPVGPLQPVPSFNHFSFLSFIINLGVFFASGHQDMSENGYPVCSCSQWCWCQCCELNCVKN